MHQHRNNPNPTCPKCCYDQAGEVATWETQCPMQGVCTECGHEFQWSEPFRILNEWGSEVDWNAEHAHSVRAMVLRTPSTALRIVFPSLYFRSMNFRRRVSIKTLCIWTIAMSVILWTLSSIPAGFACSVEYSWSSLWWSLPENEIGWYLRARDLLNAVSYPFLRWHYHDGLAFDMATDVLSNAYIMTFGLIPFLAITIFWGVLVFLIPKSRTHAIQNPWLIARGALLGLMPVVILVPVIRTLSAIYVYRGWQYQDEWVVYAEIASWFMCLFWQQCIWTAFVRWGMGVQPSWYVNLPGFVGSLIFGFITMLWFIM